MDLKLEDDRRARAAARLQQMFQQEFDETLSEFRAGQIIDLMLKTLGPEVYNQAVQDVRAHLQTRLDDLDGEVYVDPEI
jgi:uncharacterized protein (DUF2164 family)